MSKKHFVHSESSEESLFLVRALNLNREISLAALRNDKNWLTIVSRAIGRMFPPPAAAGATIRAEKSEK